MTFEVVPQIAINIDVEPLAMTAAFDGQLEFSQGNCFGIEALGLCGAVPTGSGQIYLSVGEALAVLGLLVAFIQIAEPRFRIRLAVAPFPGRVTIYALFVGGTALAFVASLWSMLTFHVPPLFASSRIFEVLAGMCFAAAFSIMFWRMARAAHFSARNAEEYYELVRSWIARGETGHLSQLALELWAAMPTVIAMCKKIEVNTALNGENSKQPKGFQYIWALPDLLADPIMAKVLVTSGVPALNILYYEVAKREAYGLYLQNITRSVVLAGLQNKESIFFRENAYGSLGRGKVVTRVIFSNFRMVDAYFPLDAFNSYSSELSGAAEFKLWISFLELAVEDYIQKYSARYPSAFSRAFQIVNSVAMNAVGRIGNLPISANVYEAEDFNRIDAAAHCYEGILKKITGIGAGLPLAAEKDLHTEHNRTFLAAVADGIFEFYNLVASVKAHWSEIRSACTQPIFELYSRNNEGAREQIDQIRNRLNYKMIERVKSNLLEVAYPPVTPLLISLFHLNLNGQTATARDQFAQMLTDCLRQNFRDAYLMNKENAQSLLPENFKYDPEKEAIVVWSRENRREPRKILGELKID